LFIVPNTKISTNIVHGVRKKYMCAHPVSPGEKNGEMYYTRCILHAKRFMQKICYITETCEK
jgi:hypothetical protein